MDTHSMEETFLWEDEDDAKKSLENLQINLENEIFPVLIVIACCPHVSRLFFLFRKSDVALNFVPAIAQLILSERMQLSVIIGCD